MDVGDEAARPVSNHHRTPTVGRGRDHDPVPPPLPPLPLPLPLPLTLALSPLAPAQP